MDGQQSQRHRQSQNQGRRQVGGQEGRLTPPPPVCIFSYFYCLKSRKSNLWLLPLEIKKNTSAPWKNAENALLQ